MKNTKQNITFRIDPEMNSKISQMAKDKNISQSELVRHILEIGFENTDYKKVSDKYDVLFDRMQKMSDDMIAHFKKISYEIEMLNQRNTRFNNNIVRANIFLEEFSLRLIPRTADYVDMRNQIKIRHTELKNMATDGEA
ncbi:MAG: hypothetical protein KJ737_13025 [Proteobacteria bacterium]|nr:hypothetical protein [Pseudomonadota bacterium]